MDGLAFTEEDKKKLIDFMNMTATHAKLNLDTQQLIVYFKLLSFMQQTLIPKVDAHILEVKRVIQPKSES